MAGEAAETEELLDPEMSVDQESADILDMSDDELDAYYAKQTEDTSDGEEKVQTEDTDEKTGEVLNEADLPSDDSGQVGDAETDQESEAAVADEAIDEKAASGAKGDEPDSNAEPAPKQDKAGDDKPGEVDYKAEYEKILKPFKANGRMISVDNIDDAITLMQMGANYNKKMAALKPSLRVVKLLEQNDLLDEGKLNHLIDVSKNDPGAISKLLKDANIDPEDIEKDVDYQPKTRQVNDAQIALDHVLDDIKDNESYSQTVKIVGNQWDKASRDLIMQNPEIIRVVDEHVQTGIYDIIAAELDKERALGRYTGMSDLEAYKLVGDKLHQAGKFSDTPEADPSADSNTLTAKPDEAGTDDTSEQERQSRKKAAAVTGSKTPDTRETPNLDPLSMSDEEFEKASAKGLFN